MLHVADVVIGIPVSRHELSHQLLISWTNRQSFPEGADYPID